VIAAGIPQLGESVIHAQRKFIGNDLFGLLDHDATVEGVKTLFVHEVTLLDDPILEDADRRHAREGLGDSGSRVVDLARARAEAVHRPRDHSTQFHRGGEGRVETVFPGCESEVGPAVGFGDVLHRDGDTGMEPVDAGACGSIELRDLHKSRALAGRRHQLKLPATLDEYRTAGLHVQNTRPLVHKGLEQIKKVVVVGEGIRDRNERGAAKPQRQQYFPQAGRPTGALKLDSAQVD